MRQNKIAELKSRLAKANELPEAERKKWRTLIIELEDELCYLEALEERRPWDEAESDAILKEALVSINVKWDARASHMIRKYSDFDLIGRKASILVDSAYTKKDRAKFILAIKKYQDAYNYMIAAFQGDEPFEGMIEIPWDEEQFESLFGEYSEEMKGEQINMFGGVG